MLRSYSVVVPVRNKQALIRRTLGSIVESMAFFERESPWADEVRGEIVIVDDGSTDGTTEVVRAFAEANPCATVVTHTAGQGIGAARNAGVRASRGEVLFFCDGDDLYLPPHIFVGLSILARSAQSTETDEGPWMLRVGAHGHVSFPAFTPVAAVRTAVRLADSVHPYWKFVASNGLAQALCTRRECHEWCEGFPEDAVYTHIGGCEDGAYSQRLQTFCRVLWVDMETVEYVRHPGNSLDLQMSRFQTPPGAPAIATPAQWSAHSIRGRLERERMQYLLDKWLLLGPPPLSPRLLNWTLVIQELVRAGRRAAAEDVVRAALAHGVVLPEGVLDDEPADAARRS